MQVTSTTSGCTWFPSRSVERAAGGGPGSWRKKTLYSARTASSKPAGEVSPREHIERIRRSKGVGAAGGIQSSLVQDLHRSVKLLSEGLYSEDIHFIKEILQNAEDAAYTVGMEPAITLELKEKDATSTPGAVGMLVTRLNEVGFSKADVEAVCSVGGSTKSKARGQIGEKGIGYKAVFTVSRRPHIASSGYFFRFDEEAEDGLGYIVPTWVEPFPVLVGPKETVHLLPLKAGKLSFLKEQIRLLQPELLLFLKKIRRVEHFASGSKVVLQKVTEGRIVKVLARTGSGDAAESQYWVWHQEATVPPSAVDDSRKGVTSTRLSVAFPLKQQSSGSAHKRSLYAFLPLEVNSPFSFVVNADFVLSSSRERMKYDAPWNRWLLQDVLPCAFLDAFQALLREGAKGGPDLAYTFVPVALTVDRTWDPVRNAILAKLQRSEVISVWSSPAGGAAPARTTLALPSQCVLFPKPLEPVFDVLEAAPSLPSWFQGKHIVHPDLSRKHEEVMAALKVKTFSAQDFAQMMLKDVHWVQSLPEDLYVKVLLQVLVTQMPGRLLHDAALIPLEGGGWGRCTKGDKPGGVHVHYVADPKVISAFQDARRDSTGQSPRFGVSCLRHSVYQKMVDSEKARTTASNVWQCPACRQRYVQWETSDGLLHHLLQTQHAETKGGKSMYRTLTNPVPEWLEEAGLKPLSVARYCLAEIESLRKLVQHEKGGRVRSEIMGWLHTLWRLSREEGWTSKDVEDFRKHMYWITEDGNVTQRPDGLLPPHSGNSSWARVFDPAGVRHIALSAKYVEGMDSDQAASLVGFLSMFGIKDIPDWMPASSHGDFTLPPFAEPLDMDALHKLLEWLEKFQDNEFLWVKFGKPTEFSRGLMQRSWLPTAAGMRRPCDAVVDSPRVRELLGGDLPFLLPEFRISARLAGRLGLRSVPPLPAIAACLEAIKQGRGTSNETTKARVEGIYRMLEEVCDDPQELRHLFDESEFVLVGGAWRSPATCLWEMDERVFRGDFAALSGEYPRCRAFFVDKLGVRPRQEAVDYVHKWLRICASGVQPPDEATWSVWRGILSGSSDFLRSLGSQQGWLLPTVGRQLRPPGEVVVADAEAWKAFRRGLGFPAFGFAWPGPDTELSKDAALPAPEKALADTFVRLGALRCPENLEVQKRPGSDPTFPGKNVLLTKHLLRAIDIYQQAKIPGIADDKVMADFRETVEVIHRELLDTFILTGTTGGELARVDVERFARWDRKARQLHLKSPGLDVAADPRIHAAFPKLIASNLIANAEDARRTRYRTDLMMFILALLGRSAEFVDTTLRNDPDLAPWMPKAKIEGGNFSMEQGPPLVAASRGSGEEVADTTRDRAAALPASLSTLEPRAQAPGRELMSEEGRFKRAFPLHMEQEPAVKRRRRGGPRQRARTQEPGTFEDDSLAEVEFELRSITTARRGTRIGDEEARAAIEEVLDTLVQLSMEQKGEEQKDLAWLRQALGTRWWQEHGDAIVAGVGWALQWPTLSDDNRERAIGLLTLAMLPPSVGAGMADNRRLAFLGDTCLNLYSTELLYGHAADEGTGVLADWRSHLVREEACTAYFDDMNLEQHLITKGDFQCKDNLGARLGSAPRTTPRIKAEAFEAILGAIFLTGGLESGRNFFWQRVKAAANWEE